MTNISSTSDAKLSPNMRKFEALSEVIVDSSISLGTPNEIASAPHLDEFVCPLRYFLQELIIELSELYEFSSFSIVLRLPFAPCA